MLVVNHSRSSRLSAAFRLTLALVALVGEGHAGDLFVATNGVNDSTAGRGLSIGSPYRTIDYAADRAAPGDTIFIRGGTYRETVTPAVSGTSGSPIVFTPYGSEIVTISGLNPIVPNASGAGAWEADPADPSGQTYRIQLTASYGSDSGWSKERITGCQVFVNGEAMSEARWPNAPTPLGIRRSEAATAESGSRTKIGTTTVYAAAYQLTSLSQFPDGVWKDGVINYAAGSGWYRRASTITGNSANEVRFNYDPYNEAANRENPNVGDPFFMMGRRIALDAEREYFFDTIQGASSPLGRDGPRHMLYLRMPGSVSPTGNTIEMRNRSHAINISAAAHLRFENLRILGGRIRTAADTANCTFTGISAEYGAYTWQEELGDGAQNSNLFEGSGHRILDSRFANSTGSVLQVVSGDDMVFRNCVVSNSYQTGVQIKNDASRIDVEQVTFYNSGGGGVSGQARPGNVLYSHGYLTSLFATDIACLNANNQDDALGSEWAYNWLHDVQGARDNSRDWYGSGGLRLDSGPANYLIHHNIIWNTTHPEHDIGMWAQSSTNANYQNARVRIFNNTVQQQIGLIETYSSPASVKGFEITNNLAGVGLEMISSSTDASGKLYLTDIVMRNNVLPNRSVPANPVPPHSGNRQGSPGWSNATAPPFGYLPSPTSQAIDNGIVIPGLTDGFIGAAPDIGALEFGLKPFVPGAKVRAGDLANLTVSTAVVGNVVKFTISSLPLGRSFPDAFRLKVGSAAASNDFSQTFDFNDHTVTASFNAHAIPGAGQTVQVSLDGISFVTLPATLAVPSATLAATTTALVSDAVAVTSENSVTFAATVSTGIGSVTGGVTFYDGATSLGVGTLNAAGIATLTVSSWSLGLHSITAVYGGGASHAASTSPILIQQILPAEIAPLGIVRARFSDGKGTATAAQYPGITGDGWVAGWTKTTNADATVLSSPALAAGGNFLKITRTGGTGQDGIFRQWSETARPSNEFSRLTFDFRIDSDATFNNNGDVYSIIFNNSATVAPGVSSTIYIRSFGAANSTTTGPISAREWCVFNGNPGIENGYDINRFRPTGLVAVPGTTYRFTVDIYAATAAGNTAGKAHGTYDVTISDGSRTVFLGNSGFRAAAYSSGGYLAFPTQQNLTTDNLAFSVDSIEMVTLPQQPTNTTVASSANPASSGVEVTFTATVASASGTPTGNVAFLDGSTPLGTAALNVSGVATLTTSALSPGARSITASFGGNLVHAASTSAALAQTILASTTTTLASSANPANPGQALTFTATIASFGGTPTGTVAFFDGGVALGSATVDGLGTATLTTSALAAGLHAITAEFAANVHYSGSVSSPLNQIIRSAYDGWLASHFTPDQLADEDRSGPTADFDADGMVTLLEYATGTDPTESGSVERPVVAIDAGGFLTLSFQRIADPFLLYEVVGGDTLQTWFEFWSSTGAANTAGRVTVTDNVPPPRTSRFLRLRVTR